MKHKKEHHHKVMHHGRHVSKEHPAHPEHEYKIKHHSSHRHMEKGYSHPESKEGGSVFGHTPEDRLSKSTGGHYGKGGRPEMDMNQMGKFGGELPSGCMSRRNRAHEE
jgi:hypothetical protein